MSTQPITQHPAWGAETSTPCPHVTPEGRTVALSVGPLATAALAETRRLLAEAKNHPVIALRSAFTRLVAGELITETEAGELSEMAQLVFDVSRDQVAAEEARERLEQAHQRLVLDPCASPVALAIAGTSVQAVTVSPSLPPGTVALAASRGDIGMVGGAAAGAVIGGAIGGVGGAIIGAVVGGIAGGVGGACLG